MISVLSIIIACKDHREVFEDTKKQVIANGTLYDYVKPLVNMCSTQLELFAENDQIPFPFEPKCDERNPDNYALTQSNSYCGSNWCSTPVGTIIKETHTLLSIPNCNKLPCKYNGKFYNHGDDVEDHPNGAW